MRTRTGSRAVRWATAFYRLSARALPSEFRRAFGDELAECFERIAVEARRRGRLAVAAVTVRSALDVARRAPREHLAAARAGALGASTGWSGTLTEVGQAVRRLRRRPSFAAASVLTLGLGIAAATSVFSLVHGVVLSPLPYPDSDRIVVVDHGGTGLGIDAGLGITYGFYRFYSEGVRRAESLAMYTTIDQTLTGRGEPVRLRVTAATPSLTDVLRTTPAVGRWFTADEGRPGASPVAVLSDGLWRERFDADPAALGAMVELNGRPHEVVGVMPAAFAFPEGETAAWIPRVVPSTGIGGWNELAVGRLAADATAAELEAELESLLPVIRASNDDPARVAMYLDEARVFPRVQSLKDSVVGDVRATLWILLGTVGFVLLIALANVANLFLVRAEEGTRETAVRTALGADRARLVRGNMAETLLIAGLAGALGIAAAAAAVRVLRLRAPVDVPRLDEVALDPTVVAVAVAASLAAAILLGLVPSLRRGGDLSVELKEGTGRTTPGRRRLRGRNVLVATQVALALVLLIGSGLLLRTFGALRSVDLGFSQREALTFELGLPGTRYDGRESAGAFHEQLLSRLGAIPGVTTAALVAQCLPLSGHMCWGEIVEAEGHPTPEGQAPPVIGARVASREYFEAMGIPVRGRTFERRDEAEGGEHVVIMSEAGAAAYFGDDDALGRRIRFDEEGPWFTVVGIAGDVRSRVATADFLRVLYLPMRPDLGSGPSPHTVSYVLATSVPPATVAPAVRRTVTGLDPAIPLASVRTLAELVSAAMAPTAFALTLIGLAAIIAVLLGAVGVYAVVAYAVSRRTAEIGVRMAVGAGAADVRRMVLRQGAGVVVVGMAAGLVGAVVLTRFLRGMLYGVAPTDPATYLLLVLLMAAVALAALWLPARRAARVQPLEALRSD